MIVLSALSPMKHDVTNGSSVLPSVCSLHAMMMGLFSLESWLSLFSGHLSRQVIASLFDTMKCFLK